MEPKEKTPFSFKKFFKALFRELIVPIFLALIVIQYVIQAFQIPSGSMEDSLKTGDFLLGLKFTYGSPIPFSNKKFPEMTLPKHGDVVIFRYPGEPEYPDGNPERYTHLFNALMFGNYYWDHEPGEGQPHLVHYADGPKDYIKRCVGVSGDTIAIHGGRLFVNGVKQDTLPGMGKYTATKRTYSPRDERDAFVVPSVGDTLYVDSLPLEQAWWLRSLISQENPDEVVEFEISLLKDGAPADHFEFDDFKLPVERDRNGLLSQLLQQNRVRSEGRAVYEGDTVSAIVPFAVFKNIAKQAYIPLVDPQEKGGFSRPVSYMGIESSLFQDLEGNVNMYNAAGTAVISKDSVGDVTASDSAVAKTADSLNVDSLKVAGAAPAKPKLEIRRKMTLGGKPLDYYVVQTPQFFMMGDNRDNSLDSRYWGFVSLRNIKAKAFVIYFSFENEDESFALGKPYTWWRLPMKIRWSRIGKIIPLID